VGCHGIPKTDNGSAVGLAILEEAQARLAV
jgi:hypothetical protein